MPAAVGSRRSKKSPSDPESTPVADWRESIQFTEGEQLRMVYVSASQLAAHPSNWRLHPESQRAALAEVIDKVGFTTPPLFNLTTGRLLDGHLRKEWAGDRVIPVVVGRWTEEQERMILATHDPITAMAKTDAAKLTQLMADMPKLEQADLGKMLTDLTTAAEESAAAVTAEAAKANNGGGPGGDDDETETTHAVLVKCDSETDQAKVLDALEARGWDVRALTVGFPKPEVNTEPAPPIAADGLVIQRTVDVVRSSRVKQMEGLFDCPPAKKCNRSWRLNWSLTGEWNIGLIVGPSGSGKSTIARELFGDKLISGWPWDEKRSILDSFPAELDMPTVTGLLSSVGFSSPPDWGKPYGVLSNGEKFRVDLARTLAECKELAVVDEFTSVVDRLVAQVGSSALAKAVRARNLRFVAVACHYDIIEWLQPDWVVDLAKIDKHGNVPLERRSLRRRPDVEISIRRVGTDRWPLFRPHHYLSGSLHRSAKCFMAEVDGRPAAFTAVLHYAHFNGGWWREHRTVCLPDFQGIGLGNRMSEFVASLYLATGKPYRSTTSHPSMIRHRSRSPLWRTVREPSLAAPGASRKIARNAATMRMTAGFEYVGPMRADEAKRLGVVR